MKKAEIIEFLIDNDIDTISQMANQDDFSYIESLLREGFIGYSKMSKADLTKEYLERTEG